MNSPIETAAVCVIIIMKRCNSFTVLSCMELYSRVTVRRRLVALSSVSMPTHIAC
jgi:hypothetical protein